MEFKFTSRKDDMISLCYMMFYMLNDLSMPGFKSQSTAMRDADTIKVFKMVKSYKQIKVAQLMETNFQMFHLKVD